MTLTQNDNVPPEAHAQSRFSWAKTNRKKTYAHNESRVKYLREKCKILFGPDALRAVRKYKGKITTVELNIEFIEGLK